jgi:hypothetical protein
MPDYKKSNKGKTHCRSRKPTMLDDLLLQLDWDCGKFAIADAIRGSSTALAPLWIAKAIWWPSAPSLNRTLELRSIEGAARRRQPLAENRT